MWDAAAKKLAIKAIATVESNLKYDAINYNDPITVGIAQWYGTRAAHLLNQMKATPAWVGVAASVTNDLNNNAENDASFWTDRFLTGIEGSSLKPVLRSDTGVQIQNAQTIADLETYKARALRAGLDADTETQAFIFFAVLYHQGPRYALNILNSAGENPSLERLYTMARAHHFFGGFRTRLDTAKAIILSGDYSGIPEFGVDPSEEHDGGDPSDSDEAPLASGQKLGDIRHVTAVGNSIHIVLADGQTVICQPTGTGYSWLPDIDSQPGTTPVIAPTTPEANPSTPPASSGVQATLDALAAFLLARVGQYYYSQGSGRLTPDTSGVTDCSALVRYAYKKVAGIEIGLTTVDQQRYGDVVWRNTAGNPYGAVKNQIPDLGILRKGDLIYFGWYSTFTRVNHVEMYLGDGRLIGHGVPGTYGPTIKSSAVNYMNTAPWIIVRRFI